jgi:hypothetical protein
MANIWIKKNAGCADTAELRKFKNYYIKLDTQKA